MHRGRARRRLIAKSARNLRDSNPALIVPEATIACLRPLLLPAALADISQQHLLVITS